MLTVACVLKSGGIYDASWVTPLKNAVANYLPVEHRFVCLSDVDVPCDRIPLEHDWPRWWGKIEVFKLGGPLLYLDLDTAIVGDLTEIARHARQYEFTVLRDFYRPEGFGSGVMAWECDISQVYRIFMEDPDGWMKKAGGRGDQGFIEELCLGEPVQLWQDALSGQFVSYKAHNCQYGIPPDARVVCLHGPLKFKDMPVNDSVRRAWEMAA